MLKTDKNGSALSPAAFMEVLEDNGDMQVCCVCIVMCVCCVFVYVEGGGVRGGGQAGIGQGQCAMYAASSDNAAVTADALVYTHTGLAHRVPSSGQRWPGDCAGSPTLYLHAPGAQGSRACFYIFNFKQGQGQE